MPYHLERVRKQTPKAAALAETAMANDPPSHHVSAPQPKFYKKGEDAVRLKALFNSLSGEERRTVTAHEFIERYPEFKKYNNNSVRTFYNSLRKQANTREVVEDAKMLDESLFGEKAAKSGKSDGRNVTVLLSTAVQQQSRT